MGAELNLARLALSRMRIASLLLSLLLSAVLTHAQPRAQADDIASALAAARTRGCTGGSATIAPLRQEKALDDAARQAARGMALQEALEAASYRATRIYRISMQGHESVKAIVATMTGRYCARLTDPGLTALGVYRRGNDATVLLAAPFSPPGMAAAGEVAQRVLALVNDARSQPRACGNERFEAAPPLAYDALLEAAAQAHAQDMSRRNFFDHRGSDGGRASQRASRAGYRWREVGENIAGGQTNAESVVAGWIASPGHCANLMRREFTQMGVAYAVDKSSELGIYWAQVFGRPR